MEIGHCSANLTAHLEDSLSPRSSAVFVLEPFFDELLQLLDPGLFGQGQAVRGARWGLTSQLFFFPFLNTGRTYQASNPSIRQLNTGYPAINY